MKKPVMSFSGANLDLLFDALQDAIGNVETAIGLLDNHQTQETQEALDEYNAIKADYVALLNRIHEKRTT